MEGKVVEPQAAVHEHDCCAGTIGLDVDLAAIDGNHERDDTVVGAKRCVPDRGCQEYGRDDTRCDAAMYAPVHAQSVPEADRSRYPGAVRTAAEADRQVRWVVDCAGMNEVVDDGSAEGESIPASSATYRGVPIAVVVFLSTGLTVGTSQYAFGEFVGPLRDSFGWTQTQLNLSLTLAAVSGLLSPFIGRAVDRWGARPVASISLACISMGFLIRPFMSAPWHWYVASAFTYAGFPGATVFPAGTLVGLWFPSIRGRVMGAVTAGNNVGGLTMAPLAAVVIAAAGWRVGYLVFGLVMATLSLAAWLVIREDPIAVAQEMRRTGYRYGPRPPPVAGFDPGAAIVAGAAPTDSAGPAPDSAAIPDTGIDTAATLPSAGLTVSEALRTTRFWLILGGLFAGSVTYQGVLTQLRQHLEESGFAPAAATAGLALIAAMGVGSKLLFGRASERITARWATVISLALQATGVAVLSVSTTVGQLWIGVVIYGLGFGGLGALIVLIVQESFGTRAFGGIMGVIQAATIGSMSGAPTLAGWLHDRTGSFAPAFQIFVVVFAVGIGLLIASGRTDASRIPTQPKSATGSPARHQAP